MGLEPLTAEFRVAQYCLALSTLFQISIRDFPAGRLSSVSHLGSGCCGRSSGLVYAWFCPVLV